MMGKNKMFPIFIISKGRADLCLTAEILKSEKLDFNIIIEPQDEINYRKRYDNLIVMDKDNQGIYYARNYCFKCSTNSNYHWQMGDNIKAFRKRINNKNIKTSIRQIISEIESTIIKFNNIGGAGLNHSVFAFSKINEIDINKQIYSCMLLNNKINCKFNDNIIEDTDYSMQILNKGLCTLLFNHLLMDKVTTGTMPGGNTNTEHSKVKSYIRYKTLIDKWHCFQMKQQPNGRFRIKPSRVWNTFKQLPK